ncbi:hypothetical protein ABZS29_37005 [Kribbella sp. NPDC005582]|uniref:hypothetical protein n=1 Tax=Kribbella sp. NPDC005582 TaxID=3156893 RepID=UPI0033AF7523
MTGEGDGDGAEAAGRERGTDAPELLTGAEHPVQEDRDALARTPGRRVQLHAGLGRQESLKS